MFTKKEKPKAHSNESNKRLPFFQAKLKVGKPGDKYEVEADKMADKVVNNEATSNAAQKKEGEEEVQQKPLASEISPLIQKMETSEEESVQKMEEEEPIQKMEDEEPVQKMEEEEPVQKMEDEEVQQKEDEEVQAKSKNNNNKSPSIEGKLRNGSGGTKMDNQTKNEMESGFGADFSNVNIHNDSEAAQMSQDVGAQAFTHGNDVYFNQDKYNPNSKDGKHLLAHELTHTIQQKGVSENNVQLIPQNPENTPFDGTIIPWSAALRETANPNSAVLADLPRGHQVSVISGRAWIFVSTVLNDTTLEGYMSHELINRSSSVALVEPESVAEETQGISLPTPEVSRAGANFDTFMQAFGNLERAAITEGYSLTQRITAFRKVYYDSATPIRSYAGATIGGGAWNILIPGAVDTDMPTSWQTEQGLVNDVAFLNANNPIPISGIGNVDIGHLLTGMDAGEHLTDISILGGVVQFRSNKEATTFIGDLGSVVVEYMEANNTASFRDVAMEINNGILATTYTLFASEPDMAGNVDAYALTLDRSITLNQNLINYYTATSGGVNQRYTQFCRAIGLGALISGNFMGDNPILRSVFKDEIFNSALAYAAANGRRGDIVLVFNEPGPGLFAPTFWEMYFNITGWVLDQFINDMIIKVTAE